VVYIRKWGKLFKARKPDIRKGIIKPQIDEPTYHPIFEVLQLINNPI